MLFPLLLPNHILMFFKEELKTSSRKYMPQTDEIPSTFLSTISCAKFTHGNFKILFNEKVFSIGIISIRIKRK